jgi:hypothetical protein
MKQETKKITIKEQVIQDFEDNKRKAIELGFNYFFTGSLKYYLFKDRFPTYAGRIVAEYCKQNDIQIMRAGDVGIDEWLGEKVHQNTSLYMWKN